jgi:LPS-assembly protein
LGVTSQINEYWRVGASALRDLEEKRTLLTRLSALYEDDCFVFETSAARRQFRDRSIDPEYIIQLRVGFKFLGEISAGL